MDATTSMAKREVCVHSPHSILAATTKVPDVDDTLHGSNRLHELLDGLFESGGVCVCVHSSPQLDTILEAKSMDNNRRRLCDMDQAEIAFTHLIDWTLFLQVHEHNRVRDFVDGSMTLAEIASARFIHWTLFLKQQRSVD